MNHVFLDLLSLFHTVHMLASVTMAESIDSGFQQLPVMPYRPSLTAGLERFWRIRAASGAFLEDHSGPPLAAHGGIRDQSPSHFTLTNLPPHTLSLSFFSLRPLMAR